MRDDASTGVSIVTTEHPAVESADDDTRFTEAPQLRRLGTLAELTLGVGSDFGDVAFGFDGDFGETSDLP